MEKLKVGMGRNFPSENNPLMSLVKNFKNPLKDYEKFVINIEKSIEKDLIKILKNLNIKASVKTDRYSLPIKYQIKTTQYGESYLNAAFETEKLYRNIVKDLLNKDVYKIRFYIFAEIEDCFPMGKVNYYVNYHY